MLIQACLKYECWSKLVFNTNADPSLSLIRMVIRACLKYECWSKLVFNTNADPSLSLIQMLIQACLKYECWSKLVFNANIDPSLFLKPPSLVQVCFIQNIVSAENIRREFYPEFTTSMYGSSCKFIFFTSFSLRLFLCISI